MDGNVEGSTDLLLSLFDDADNGDEDDDEDDDFGDMPEMGGSGALSSSSAWRPPEASLPRRQGRKGSGKSLWPEPPLEALDGEFGMMPDDEFSEMPDDEFSDDQFFDDEEDSLSFDEFFDEADLSEEEMRTELQELRPEDLQKKARSMGASNEELDQVVGRSDVKAALVELIIRKTMEDRQLIQEDFDLLAQQAAGIATEEIGKKKKREKDRTSNVSLEGAYAATDCRASGFCEFSMYHQWPWKTAGAAANRATSCFSWISSWRRTSWKTEGLRGPTV
jgi:hypothetical protein